MPIDAFQLLKDSFKKRAQQLVLFKNKHAASRFVSAGRYQQTQLTGTLLIG